MTARPEYPDAAKLAKLSDEVGRISSVLARLSASSERLSEAESPRGRQPSVSRKVVQQVLRARRRREFYFPADLFADPAWDMMLELLCAEMAEQRMSVSSLCFVSGVPSTTALRWQKKMVKRGLLIEHRDSGDGRRIFVELAPETSQAMRAYFVELERISIANNEDSV